MVERASIFRPNITPNLFLEQFLNKVNNYIVTIPIYSQSAQMKKASLR